MSLGISVIHWHIWLEVAVLHLNVPFWINFCKLVLLDECLMLLFALISYLCIIVTCIFYDTLRLLSGDSTEIVTSRLCSLGYLEVDSNLLFLKVIRWKTYYSKNQCYGIDVRFSAFLQRNVNYSVRFNMDQIRSFKVSIKFWAS